MDLVLMLFIGALAGRLASFVFKSSSLGIYGNIIVGILGSAAGFWIFGMLGITFDAGMMSSILMGTIGALVILILMNILFPGRRAA